MIIDDARVAERFASVRPGYKLLACEEAALPQFLISTPVLIQQRMPIPPIDEFVLRGINDGLSSVDQIAAFFGLEEDLVTLSLSRLWRSDLVDMPVASAGRKLRITTQGFATLEELSELIPSEQLVYFSFDRLLWKSVPNSTRDLLRPKEVEQQGLLRIKPRLVKKPEVVDLPARDVDRAIKVSMKNVLSDASVLLVKRIERAEQKYLPCHILVYESLDGLDHVLEISVDGRLREDIRNALDALGGVEYFDFDFASSALSNTSEIQPVTEIAARVKTPVVPLEVVDEFRRQASAAADDEPSVEIADVATGRPVAIENLEVRHIDTFEHPTFLNQAISEAKRRLLITSPWVKRAVVRREFVDKLYQAARRGVEIHIGYGIDYEGSECDVDAVEKLEKLAKQFKNVHLACLGSTHAKILIWDDNEITTSFNWLSYRGDQDRTYRQEHGVLLRNQGQITDHNWTEQKDWIERAAKQVRTIK
jgi:hypothetical protein